jgi:hypothetical protein
MKMILKCVSGNGCQLKNGDKYKLLLIYECRGEKFCHVRNKAGVILEGWLLDRFIPWSEYDNEEEIENDSKN